MTLYQGNSYLSNLTLNVAEVFEREHKDVLDKIQNCHCSQEFARRNFTPGEYADKNNQMRPMYEMTRDGFSFLVMDFTVAKAAQFKEAYIYLLKNHLKTPLIFTLIAIGGIK